MRTRVENVSGRKMIPVADAVLELLGLADATEVELFTDTGRRLVVQAVGSAEVAPADVAAKTHGGFDPDRPKDSARAIKALIPLGLDLRCFRAMHHFAGRASLTSHLKYCESINRFTSDTNVTVAKRLFKLLELRRSGVPMDEAVAAAVLAFPFGAR